MFAELVPAGEYSRRFDDDVDVELALARINLARDGVARLFEKKDFLEKVRANYLELRGPNLVKIDGNPALDAVMGDVLRRFGELGGTWSPPRG